MSTMEKSSNGSNEPEYNERPTEKQEDVFDVDVENTRAVNAKFENPLANVTREKLMQDVEDFCQKYDMMDDVDILKKGALVAQRPHAYQEMNDLTNEEKIALDREHTHKWSQPWMLYWLVCMSSMAACVQGMDESVNNGAQAFYLKEFGVTDTNIQGLIVSAPYLACAVLGCWLTEPLNAILARRGTIFLSCFVAAVASIWEGVANSWVNLFIARFVLGLGIGAKSTTVPVYTAECAPAPIRGALVMQWQVWTAFGISQCHPSHLLYFASRSLMARQPHADIGFS